MDSTHSWSEDLQTDSCCWKKAGKVRDQVGDLAEAHTVVVVVGSAAAAHAKERGCWDRPLADTGAVVAARL